MVSGKSILDQRYQSMTVKLRAPSREDRKGKIFSPPVLLRATREHRGSREERLSQRRGVEVLFGFLLANESKQYFKVSALRAADTMLMKIGRIRSVGRDRFRPDPKINECPNAIIKKKAGNNP